MGFKVILSDLHQESAGAFILPGIHVLVLGRIDLAVLVRIFWPRTRSPTCRGQGLPCKPIGSGASAQRDVFAGTAAREVAVPVRTQAGVLVGGTRVLAKNSRNHRVSLLLVTPGKSLRVEPEEL